MHPVTAFLDVFLRSQLLQHCQWCQCHRHPHNSYQLEYILATIRMNEHYVFFSRHFRCNNNGLLQPFIQAASLETLKISGCGPCNSVAVFKSYQPINWCVNNKKWQEHVANMFNPSIFNPRKTWLLKTWLQKKQLWESEGTSYVLQLSTRKIHLKLMELMEQIVAILTFYLHIQDSKFWCPTEAENSHVLLRYWLLGCL